MFRWVISLMITSMIFFPEKAFYDHPRNYDFQWEDVALETSDDVRLHSWYLKADNELGAILFLHGNAGNISGRLFKASGWVQRGFSVLLVDYRGYGQSRGKISHGDDLIRDAESALRWLMEVKKIPIERIVFYGESLGSYPVVYLGARNKALATILESPYSSFVELGSAHYGFIPKPLRNVLIKDFAFPNTVEIKNLQTPLMIIHGTHDDICPHKMGEEVFKAAPEPKEFYSIQNGHHNDLPDMGGKNYWDRPFRFLSGLIEKSVG